MSDKIMSEGFEKRLGSWQPGDTERELMRRRGGSVRDLLSGGMLGIPTPPDPNSLEFRLERLRAQRDHHGIEKRLAEVQIAAIEEMIADRDAPSAAPSPQGERGDDNAPDEGQTYEQGYQDGVEGVSFGGNEGYRRGNIAGDAEFRKRNGLPTREEEHQILYGDDEADLSNTAQPTTSGTSEESGEIAQLYFRDICNRAVDQLDLSPNTAGIQTHMDNGEVVVREITTEELHAQIAEPQGEGAGDREETQRSLIDDTSPENEPDAPAYGKEHEEQPV